MSLYPDLSEENVEEVVLVLPAHHVRLTMINDQTKDTVGVTQADLKCLLEEDRVRVVVGQFSIRLSSELFVLHDELERFVIGGVVHNVVHALCPHIGMGQRLNKDKRWVRKRMLVPLRPRDRPRAWHYQLESMKP